MKICYLGAGSWGFCLATLLASKGYQVTSWMTDAELAHTLVETRRHPRFPDVLAPSSLSFTTDLSEALADADLIVESVTSAGVRPVFEQVKALGAPDKPIIITSKGIEQDSGLLMAEVIEEVLGEKSRQQVGYLCGPSYADEVVRGLPTSVVGSAYDYDVMMKICDTFLTPVFRVYPNADTKGVAYGGALKNIVAIACGMADGLGLGHSSKAALMTRGLHEMCKLAVASGCKQETLYGLSGMGDLFVTCSSPVSRNFRFGTLIAAGHSVEETKKIIGMAIEGAYTCVSALQLSKKIKVTMPITEGVYRILYEGMTPMEGVSFLMKRTVKEEHL